METFTAKRKHLSIVIVRARVTTDHAPPIEQLSAYINMYKNCTNHEAPLTNILVHKIHNQPHICPCCFAAHVEIL